MTRSTTARTAVCIAIVEFSRGLELDRDSIRAVSIHALLCSPAYDGVGLANDRVSYVGIAQPKILIGMGSSEYDDDL